MNRLVLTAVLLAPSTAFAHPGDHTRFSIGEFMAHLLEWDHVGIAALTGAVAWLVFRRIRASRDTDKA